jgi:hypothetical protein
MDFKMQDGVIVRISEEGDKVKKKNGKGGVYSILGLLQEMTIFEQKVEDCMESQDIASIKAEVESVLNALIESEKKLVQIVQSGIGAMRQKPEQSISEDNIEEKVEKTDRNPVLSTPSIPQISKI